MEIEDSDEDIVYCDGTGDGGIDIAYLQRADSVDQEDSLIFGDTWYLIQSKYGSAFRGTATLLTESQKVIESLSGNRSSLSSLTQGLLQRLHTFQNKAGEFDKLVLVFATEDTLTKSQQNTLDNIRAMGRNRLGLLFDVEAVSIQNIYQRAIDETVGDGHIKVHLNGELTPANKDLLVGAVTLFSLHGFLKSYKKKAQDLDLLFEKNVRRFLGSKGKVNRAMYETLQDDPENFGLFNNGITIVVENFHKDESGFHLVEPYIVNGCQTTRTVWEVFQQRADSGGTGGMNAELHQWNSRARKGSVIVKIVRVGASGNNLLQSITRYTNSQNTVREKDFLALTSDFKNLAKEMARKYNIFLETQRGGWESQKAYQKQHPNERQFSEHTNAFDLIKVYGAGWLVEPGAAFGRNGAFLPNGTIFKKIFDNHSTDHQFCVDDFYAAYRIQKSADLYKFGRQAELSSRNQTRFLFYTIVIDLLKGVMTTANFDTSLSALTQAVIKIYKAGNEAAIESLLSAAIDTLDDYMSTGSEDSVFKEPAYKNTNNNLNTFLKWDQLAKSDESSPNLRRMLAITRRSLVRGNPSPSPKELILKAIQL